MAWNKIAVTNLAIFFALLIVACGGDSGNSTEVADGDGREVATLFDMGRCTSEREGDTVYVAEKLTDYLCHNGTWVDLSQSPDGPISSSAENQEYSSAEDIQGSSSSDVPNDGEESSSSFNKEAYTDENLVVKNRSILGVAQKGPFKFGSPVYLRELSEDSLLLTGMVYEDEISSNKGDFVIPNVNLIYPYASVEVRGLYRNEMTGEYSENPISLYALTDLKTAVTDSKDDARNKVNVNLLTHLEYNRAIYLVRKGYSVYAAKKQADQEIMTAFELPTTIKYSEDLSVFEDSEDDNVDYANASLMMLNLLFLGEGDDAEIKASIDKFIADIEKDGSWDDDSTKARMADFATTVNGDEIRANVKAWNILNIPMFETQMEMFWNNVYGLGGCSDKRKDIVAPNTNKLSKQYGYYFICKVGVSGYGWKHATTFEKDTYEWVGGEDGEFKKGNVTDTLYVYDGSKWVAAERETTIGLCVKSNAGVVSEFEGTYYICRDSAWVEATELEYDTYGLVGKDGAVKPGVVNRDKHYVYENGAWRASSGEIEDNLGACVTSREGEKQALNDNYYVCESQKWNQITAEEFGLGYCSATNQGVVKELNNAYYICKSNSWVNATVFEYDTYGWSAGQVGEVKKGSVTDTMYVYRNSKWNFANAVERNLGSCLSSNAGTVSKYSSTYYICKSNQWQTATTLEYDTYGWSAGQEGEVKEGSVTSTKYVYRNSKWNVASDVESNLGSCLSSGEGTVSKYSSTYYICKSNQWQTATTLEYDTYGWSAGQVGEVREGSITDAKYVYRNSKWNTASKVEGNLGSCLSSNAGTVSKYSSTYYICKSNQWQTATTLEYDTYGWSAGQEGEVKKGSVTSTKYVYRNSKWNVASDVESNLGSCLSSGEGTVSKYSSTYYICKSNQWQTATTLEYDTYGWSAGQVGEVREGSITDAKYVYRNSKWNVASTVEGNLGSCLSSNAGTVSKYSSTYYICRSNEWQTATTLEYDTYGLTCSKNGAVVSGRVVSSNKYVCDADTFRVATNDEIALNLGCTSYTQNQITIQEDESRKITWLCANEWMIKERIFNYGSLTDTRDAKTYKTIKIGNQTWMAENLNYDYNKGTAKSYCYKNSADSCAKYGRLYTWAAAIDSVALSASGKTCGYDKTCTLPSVVQGVCPDGWHLPSKAEWGTLFTNVGGESTAGTMLKSTSGWESNGNGEDAYGFSALPAGYRNYFGSFFDAGNIAYFWSSSEYYSSIAYIMYLDYDYENAGLDYNLKNNAFSVRCVQNSN